MNLDFHQLCVEVVNQVGAGNFPEATVCAWIISAVLLLVQTGFVAKRIYNKKKKSTVLPIIPTKVIPYVPGETVLKLVKLLKDQDSGWGVTYVTNSSNTLQYGNLSFTKFVSLSVIHVEHKGINIDLAKKSENFLLDQELLMKAFYLRLNKEDDKIRSKKAQVAYEAEMEANRELSHVLDTI